VKWRRSFDQISGEGEHLLSGYGAVAKDGSCEGEGEESEQGSEPGKFQHSNRHLQNAERAFDELNCLGRALT
jgi:hypothetical protein